MTITDGKKRVKSDTKLNFFGNFSIVINEIGCDKSQELLLKRDAQVDARGDQGGGGEDAG